MLAAACLQRFEHVADAGVCDVVVIDGFQPVDRRHDVGDQDLVAPDAAALHDLQRFFAMDVGAGDQPGHAVFAVHHEQQLHLAAVHAFLGLGDGVARRGDERGEAAEIGHHVERGVVQRDAFGKHAGGTQQGGGFFEVARGQAGKSHCFLRLGIGFLDLV